MVDEDEIMDLIDQLRFNLPEEMKQANWTVQEQQRLIAEAHAEATRIMSKANERAETAITEHEVLRRAARQPQQPLGEGQSRAAEIEREAGAYAPQHPPPVEASLSPTPARA